MVQVVRTIPKAQIVLDEDLYPKAHTIRMLPLGDIVPSPYQHRKNFDPVKLEELARSILQDGLISPILVRLVGPVAHPRRASRSGKRAHVRRTGRHFELIAGERRVRAIREYTDWQTIEAKIVEIDDRGARRISAAENIQREDLTVFETIEAIVALVDAELYDDEEYISMGNSSVNRVEALLGKLHSITNSINRGSKVSQKGELLLGKFAQQLEEIFKTLPKPLEWQSFYRHDLNLLVDICIEVQDASIEHNLNKSQTLALAKLNAISESEFRGIVNPLPSASRGLSDFSATEIDAIANKEIQKQALAEQAEFRRTPSLSSEGKILLLARLGIPDGRIAERLKINRKTVTRYGSKAKLFRSVRHSLDGGLSVTDAAEKWRCPEPLVWSIELEGKTDRERFKALNWGLRTWDLWFWSYCDNRFGDEWPGRIPAQLIAHILYYFSRQGHLVFDPMGGGGVVPDTCLPFNRRCWSFDMEDRPDTRPEIEPHFWDFKDLKWPVQGKAKPDLIIFDPPYFKKQAGNYDREAISGLSRDQYLEFLERFFALAHQNAKTNTKMAFINADWRDFQGTAASNEMADNAILIDDYLHIIKKSGWQRSHIMQAPLSSERFSAGVVSAMQKKRIVGVTSRYVIISSRK